MFVQKRFYRKLIEVCKEEHVRIFMHKSIKSLNVHLYGKVNYVEKITTDPGKLAAGCYVYDKHGITIPEIHLYDGSVWTFAHEIGHHFSIKYNKDRSEKAADEYIKVLVKKYMPWWHRILIPIELFVYVNMK